MKTVQPKIDNLLIENLGLIPRIIGGLFSSPRLKIKFLMLFAWKMAAPHIMLGRPESMSKQLANSSSVLLRLSADTFCCGVSGMVFSCRMPASKQYIIKCSERNSFTLSCLSFLGVTTLKTNFFRLAIASLLDLSKSTNTNFMYWSANPKNDSTMKVPSRPWTTFPASLLLGSLPLLVLESLRSLPMRTHCIYHRHPPLSLVHSRPNPLDSNNPIVCATSLHCQVSRKFHSSWIPKRGRVSKTKYFLLLLLTEFPSEVSCSCFLSRKRSYFPTPCILRLIRGLKNSPAHTKHFGIPLWSSHWNSPLFECMLILTQPLPTTLEASSLWFLTTDWMGTKSRDASMFVIMWSVQPLSKSMPALFHWVRAAQCYSSGEANIRLIATDSCLPPSLCLLHALSGWPFSQHLLHCAVSFLLQSLAKCPENPHTKQFLSLVPLFKSRFNAVPLNHFVPCVSVLFSHGSSAAFSSTLWSSLLGYSFPVYQNFHTSLADHWGRSRWLESLRLLPLLLVAL